MFHNLLSLSRSAARRSVSARGFAVALFFVVSLAAVPAWAQPQVPAHPVKNAAAPALLSTAELAAKPVFYTMDEAMLAPETVYRLNLSGQKLKEFPLEILFFRNLQELNLSNNKLETVPPEIATLTNLQVLNLHKNRLVSVPDELGDLRNLRELYLNRNRIMYFTIGIVGLQQLGYMDVSQNLLNLSEIEFLQKRLPDTELHY